LSLFNELKRRNVFRVGIAYAVATWLLLQVADIIVPLLELPEWVPKLILLLLLLGFVPALIFAWAFEMTPEGLKKEKDVDRTQSITPQTGRKLDFAIIGILALAVVILLFDKFNTGESAVNETAEQAAGAEAETPDQSIAVLPFVNMSEDAANEYFSDGISEEILNVLAGVKGLKVAGRTSSFAFKGRNEDLRMIGETLGVSHILEGSVRKAGDQLRITAQLVKVDDGFHLWSENFDRRLVDVFAIQDEIAQAILEQLKTHLIVGEPVKTAAPKSTDLKAFDLYLLAKQNIRLRNREALELADRLLGQAIEIDPQYAPAYAQQGIVRLLLVIDQYGNLPKEQSQSESRALLEKALSLDPELAEAHAGMGLYYSNETDQLDQSIASLNRALSINPGLLDASNWLQISYAYSGKIRASVEVLEDLFQRDPLYQPGFANLVNI
jgi:TolB-like protein